MKSKLIFITILILAAGAAVAFGQGQAFKQKIFRAKFAKGETSVEFKNTLRGRVEHIYMVKTRAGQKMRVILEVDADEYASIQVKDPQNLVAPSKDGTDAGEVWENTLKKSGDYRIAVFPPDTADNSDTAHYSLKIIIE